MNMSFKLQWYSQHIPMKFRRTSPKSPPLDLVPGQAEKLAALFAKSCIALGKWFIIYVFSDIM